METRPDHVEDTELLDITVPLYKLASSPTNPRTSFPADTMAELTASVKEHGVIQPLLLRAWPEHYAYTGDKPVYEIVAGERRFRAAIAAGLLDVPYLLRDLTDEQVVQIQIIENLQREDLHPLEEAEGYQKMMRDHGYSAEDLAEKIGKSRSYIFGRLKLLDLDEDSRRLFSGGLLNASTALLIARIPTTKLRAKAIKDITEKDYQGDTKSVRQAQRWIRERYMLKLVDATFPIDDAKLCGGACTTCPKRTGNTQDLFDDIDSPDVCTDPECFNDKKIAFMQRQVAKAKEDGAQVITGKEAKKIAPYGISDYNRLEDYTKLTDKCYDDPENRTYGEILGGSIEVVLIEDKEHSRLVPTVKNTALADALQAAGIDSTARKADKEKARIDAKVKQEQAYRARLMLNIRTEIGNVTLNGTPTMSEDLSTPILRLVAAKFFDRLWGDSKGQIATLWAPDGKNVTERTDNLLSTVIPGLNAGDCWRLLVDLLIIGSDAVSQYTLDSQPTFLHYVAQLFAIDPDDVRKDVADEFKAAKKADAAAKKPVTASKKAKKPTPTTSAEASSPTEAAQAGESVRDENGGLAVGDRVRIRNDLATGTAAWRRKVSGREGVIEAVDGACLDVRVGEGKSGLVKGLVWNEVDKLEPAIEAAQAGDQITGEEVMNERPFGAGECIGGFEIGGHADLIETNETPTETGDGEEWTPKVGDLVRTKNGESKMGGKLLFNIKVVKVDDQSKTIFGSETGPVITRTKRNGKAVTEKPATESVYLFSELQLANDEIEVAA